MTLTMRNELAPHPGPSVPAAAAALALALTPLAACRPAAPPATPAAAPVGNLGVAEPRCEFLRDPMGIDAPRPRLSWTLTSRARGERQTAYEIDAVSDDGRVAWRSDKIASEESTNVEWAGPPLPSAAAISWRVRVWDRADRASAWGPPARFTMGLLARADWKARWIAERATQTYAPYTPLPQSAWIWCGADPKSNTAPPRTCRFRRAFDLPADEPIARAQLLAFTAPGGAARVTLNGREVLFTRGAESLAPADVRAALRPGRNLIVAEAERAENAGADAAGFMARLLIGFAGGGAEDVQTQRDWRASADAPPGWMTAAFDERAWTESQVLYSFGFAPWGRVTLPPAGLPAPHLRKMFSARPGIRRATLFVAGVGYHEVYLNGQRVGDHVLDPAWTRYDRRVLYVTHDVTGLLRAGANAIGAILGNGWFNVHAQDVWGTDRAPWRATPRLLLQLELAYDDGTRERVVSDGSWQAGAGPILFDGIRNGETYDARRERPGFATAGEATDTYRPAIEVPGPTGILSAQTMPPIRVTETLLASRVTEPRAGVFVFDFGQNVAGWARLRLRAAAGTTVTLRYGERLFSDGTLDDREIGEGVQQGRFQTDVYVAKGAPEGEIWEPRFVYHGFRHVEMSGFPGRPPPDALEARVVHTDFEIAGAFESSNELLNRIQRAVLRSYRGNYHGYPTDCPSREKQGWTGDGHLAAEVGLLNFEQTAAYAKWALDLRDEQREDGALPAIVPASGNPHFYRWGNGPAWDSSIALVPYYLYLYRGDRRALIEAGPAIGRYVDYVSSRDYWTYLGTAMRAAPGGWLGDWVPVGERTPPAVTHAGYHYVDAKIAALAARLGGRADDARRFEAIAGEIKRRFRTQFVDAATGKVAGGTQTAQSCALYQELVDGAEAGLVAARLAENVRGKRDHLDTGILGAKYLLHALTEHGHPELAYRVATRTDYPSWGDMLERGATTLWEDWRGEASLNHVFFGDISTWFYRGLAGINPDPDAPGFAHVVFKPHAVADLDWVRATLRTPRGEIASAWRREGGVLTLTVAVPVGSRGTVHVPAAAGSRVDADGGVLLREEAGRRVYAIESGSYTFVAR